MELLSFDKAPKGPHFGVIVFTSITVPRWEYGDTEDEKIIRYHVFDTAEGVASFLQNEILSPGRYRNCPYLIVHVDKVGQATTTTTVTF